MERRLSGLTTYRRTKLTSQRYQYQLPRIPHIPFPLCTPLSYMDTVSLDNVGAIDPLEVSVRFEGSGDSET